MIRQQLFIGAALLAGVAAGYFMRGDAPAAPAAPSAASAPRTRPSRTRIADAGDAATIEALRAKIAGLERELAARGEVQAEIAETNGAERVAARPMGFRERMEQIKTSDPARYAQMTNHMARMRNMHRRRAQDRSEFLASIDVSGMSGRAKATHRRYQELIQQNEELHESLRDENLSDDERRELFQKAHSLRSEMRNVGNAERKVLLGETARCLGLGSDDSAALVETVEQVLEATNQGGGPHGPPPPDAPPPGGSR